MIQTVLIALKPNDVPSHQLAQVKSLLPEANIVITDDKDKIESLVDKVEIAAGFAPKKLVVKMPNLKWYQQWASGANWLFHYPQAIKQDFILTNVAGIHAKPITEHIFAMLLSFSRGLHLARNNQNQGIWHHPAWETLSELSDQTMLLLGVGGIGQYTAQIAKAFGMHVLAIRRNITHKTDYVDELGTLEQLPQFLPQADFVVVILPLTDETKGLINADVLQKLKPTAHLINMGRGELINEKDLIEALQQKKLAGAGLDVFETEPLAPDSPLWHMENVIVTPHYAGATPHYHKRAMSIFIDNLQRYLANKALRNVVNKTLGY